jgi:hypothetical protein
VHFWYPRGHNHKKKWEGWAERGGRSGSRVYTQYTAVVEEKI